MYEVELQSIQFSNGKRHRFPAEIAEALDFEDALVVRLVTSYTSLIQNIFAVDYRGNLLWTIPTPRSFFPQNPYVSLFRQGSHVEVLSWEGHILTLDPKRGTILSEGFYAGVGGSGNRTPSVRQWI